ncbi:MAG: matrixin family metalloprotease, partial [Phycicoccus sp.]
AVTTAFGMTAGAATTPDDGTSTSSAPTWEEFLADTYVDQDGMYVVNGDEVVDGKENLRIFYDTMVADSGSGGMNDLVVNTVGGQDDTWSASQVANLTYCVSTDFGSRYDDMVEAMAAGAAQWEEASSAVDYVYVSSEDDSCTTRNSSVLFSVEPVQTSQYIARAFFPSTSDSGRNILVDDSIWTTGSWSPANIVGHELGHTLGFRHEHTRPESGTCFEDSSWRPLTPYDSSSIMHYPQCNGTSDDLSMTDTDREGVRALYGS